MHTKSPGEKKEACSHQHAAESYKSKLFLKIPPLPLLPLMWGAGPAQKSCDKDICTNHLGVILLSRLNISQLTRP